MSVALDAFASAFDARRGELPGAGLEWLDALRTRAMERFQEAGFPHPRQEDWKYTRTAAIEKVAFDLADTLTEAPLESALLELDGPRLVFIDGHFDAAASRGLGSKDGAVVMDLAGALRDHPDLVRDLLAQELDPRLGVFCTLNAALAGDGAIVHAPRNHRVERPVELVFIASGRPDMMAHPRVLLSAAEGSEMTVVEHYVGTGDARYMTNALTQVSAGANASVSHYKLQRESRGAFHMSTLHVRQQPDSRFTSHSISLGAAIARHDLLVDLDGTGAHCALNGLYTASGRQHVDYHTSIEHHVPHCTSEEDYKGVLADRGRGVFNGRVLVHPHAQKTDSRQSNKNLLLSADAEVDTKPQLEIYADDVKCAHGATVGQLDERMVFYLRSRGLTEAEARALLTYGFACDIVDRMELEPLRAKAAESLLQQMPGEGELRSLLS